MRRIDRPTERVVDEALAMLEDVYAGALRHDGGARRAAASVVGAVTHATTALRAERTRAAADLAARVQRLEAAVRAGRR